MAPPLLTMSYLYRFLMLSDHYVIVKVCSRDITIRATPVYSEKTNLEVPVKVSVEYLPWHRKVGKMHLVSNRTFF